MWWIFTHGKHFKQLRKCYLRQLASLRFIEWFFKKEDLTNSGHIVKKNFQPVQNRFHFRSFINSLLRFSIQNTYLRVRMTCEQLDLLAGNSMECSVSVTYWALGARFRLLILEYWRDWIIKFLNILKKVKWVLIGLEMSFYLGRLSG